ncbi:MAG: ACT domain-containing protein [Nanoarchaeota archaeon]|nr:ACT domain-containing protein [Nanoarchaeota archaeon]
MLEDYFKGLKLVVLDGEYAVVKSKRFYEDAFANIKDEREITVIIKESKVKKKDVIALENDFKIFTFDTIIPFNLIGFIAKIAEILSKQNISIFTISTFTTEYVLVKKKDLPDTIKSLKKLGVKV